MVLTAKDGKEAKKYAVVTLFDWKQVPINGDCLVKYIELTDGKSTNIISQLKTPNEPGVYDLCPLIIHNPYTELSYDNRNVETGFRAGIVVE